MMTVPEQLLQLVLETYGGALLLALANFVQISLMIWVVQERWRMARESRRLAADEYLRRAAQRAAVWRMRVRPVVMTIMLISPGVGLALSTFLGALGMAALGNVLGSDASADVLRSTLAHGFAKVSYSYMLMVGGTPPMVLAPIIIALAHRFEEDEENTAGGNTDELQLQTQREIVRLLREISENTRPPGGDDEEAAEAEAGEETAVRTGVVRAA